MLDPVEEGFLAQLRARPADDTTRLVYADWLEERGRPNERDFLRVQAALRSISPAHEAFARSSITLRELARRLDPRWRAVVALAPIEACEVRFDFVCPKQWEALEPTDLGDDIRHCGSCRSNVHYSVTLDEAYAHAAQGRCVVVDVAQLRPRGDRISSGADAGPPPPLVMGSVLPPSE